MLYSSTLTIAIVILLFKQGKSANGGHFQPAMLDSDQLCDLLRFFSSFALSLVNALVSPKLICLKHLSRGYFFCVGGCLASKEKSSGDFGF